MADKEVLKRVERLRAQVDDLRYRYHVINDPEVTDQMYDGLMDELRKLEDKYPELVATDSPTQRVAGVPLDKFEKIVHQVTQWSFDDAFTAEDMDGWQTKVFNYLEKATGVRPDSLDYLCELKIDGLHVVLDYKNGILSTAATRGDGRVGENVTQNIRTIKSVPLRLREAVDVIVEGEIWMGRGTLQKLNEDRVKAEEPLFANPRNAAAGTIRQLDSKIVAARNLDTFIYDISKGEIPLTQLSELERLEQLGFKVNANRHLCKNLSEVVKFWESWQAKRNSEDYWLDGIVVKVNERQYQEALGFTGKSPRWAIAFKFATEQATTVVKDVYVQVGRTGALTPVALLEPVKLVGSTVTHATLHNFDEIKRLGIKIGDTVVVEKAGDIIPKVIRVLDKMRTGKEKNILVPKKCPVCGAPVDKKRPVIASEARQSLDKEESVAIFCANPSCYAQELERITHFVAKSAFDIDHLGWKIVARLVDEGLIKDAADLFTLTVGDLEVLDRFGEKSAANLVESVAKAKPISFPRFINALGIPNVGEETAADLAINFRTLDKLMQATVEDLIQINGVGPKVAQSVAGYFSSVKNKNLVSKLLKNGIIIQSVALPVTGKLTGKIFVLTGTLASMSRDEAKAKIRTLGGKISESVGKDTSGVIAGENSGSKYDKAKKLGIRILNEQEFLKMVA
ncbi:MAG: NAD-dependent DNA ligase LigA [bacterium]|nr:NAD-dependent DNA ligase LigA [bacterium]